MTKLFELELFSIYENLTFRKINNEGLNCLKLCDFLSRTHVNIKAEYAIVLLKSHSELLYGSITPRTTSSARLKNRNTTPIRTSWTTISRFTSFGDRFLSLKKVTNSPQHNRNAADIFKMSPSDSHQHDAVTNITVTLQI